MWFRFPRGSLSAPLTTTIDQGSKNMPTLHAAHTIDSYQAERIESLSIRWPSGSRQTFTDVPLNCELIVVESRATPVRLSVQ